MPFPLSMLSYLFTGGEFRGIDTDGCKASSDVSNFESCPLEDGGSNGCPVATGAECEVVMTTVGGKERGRELMKAVFS